jgi:hypothetical protein
MLTKVKKKAVRRTFQKAGSSGKEDRPAKERIHFSRVRKS